MKIEGLSDTIQWYDQNAQQYTDATKSHYSLDNIEKFIKLLPPNGSILDAGCSSGRDSAIFFDKGFRVTGVDLSRGLIKIAQREHPNIEFMYGSFLDMPFLEDGTLDGVWAHASLVHLETRRDVERALSEFNRVLKKDGILHILVKAQTGKAKTAVVTDELSKHDRFFQYFTSQEIKDLLLKARFEEIYFEQYRETDKNPKRRSEAVWIWSLSRKKIEVIKLYST